MTLKVQIYILRIDYFSDQSVKCWSVKYRMVFKMRTRSCHQIYSVVSYYLFLDTDQVRRRKNGICKGQTLVQWGVVARQLWTLWCRSCMTIFKIVFDNNVRNRKRCTYLKGCFKTSSKLRNIKLLVNSRYYTPHLPVNH